MNGQSSVSNPLNACISCMCARVFTRCGHRRAQRGPEWVAIRFNEDETDLRRQHCHVRRLIASSRP